MHANMRCHRDSPRPFIHGGRDFERSFLLHAATDREWKEFVRMKPALQRAGLTKENYFDWARRNQPEGWNPCCPTTRMAREFFEKVRSKLDREHRGKLRMYVATGTPLDFDAGTDFWLELNGEKVTFDITINPHKKKRRRSTNFILQIWHLASRKLENFARKIAGLIKYKLRLAAAAS